MSAAPGSPTPAPDPAAVPGAPAHPRPAAWQPLTPRGVAAFATNPWRRLFLVQLLVALLTGGGVVWFLQAACLPALQKAIANLPDEGHIEHQLLFTPLTTTTTLAAEPVLGFVVDLPRLGKPSLPSDLILVFHPADLEVCSRFGCLVFRYPKGWTIAFNRKELAAAVPAWAPFVLPLGGLVTALLLLLTWTLLATILFLIPLLVARYSDRALRFTEGWKLTGAALLPGALLVTAALVVYGSGWITLTQFSLLAVAHLLVDWVYLMLAPLTLPRAAETEAVPAENPFAPPSPPAAGSADSPADPGRTKNPFASGPASSPREAPPTGSSRPWEG